MLFQNRFLERIRRGEIRRTYRNWQSARVKVGRRYRLGSGEWLEVESVRLVVEKLRKMDRRSPQRVSWFSLLRTIGRRPRTAASQLAPEFGLDTPALKQKVRRLKGLGLTQSFPKGYDLTVRGRAALALFDAETSQGIAPDPPDSSA